MAGRLLVALLLSCLLGPVGQAAGQETSAPLQELGAHRDTLDLGWEQPFRLRPFIRPGTERIYLSGTLLDTASYRLDHRHGRLWLRQAVPDPGAELIAVYRTWPFAFKEVYRRRHMAPPDTAGRPQAGTVIEEQPHDPDRFDPFGNARLQRSGSITRGIIAGNNRDVSVESGLRMQLAGEVVDGVSVQAVLTDENTPIQPEGTTQRLSEFDRVFIQIESAQGTAQLGDFDFALAGTAFARFDRKLQGVTFFGDVPGPAGPVYAGGRVQVAGATLRGQYRSQKIEPIDGVQGPYRLEGSAGEQFIIVVAGSETVYLDGQRLTRGETNDYVIDYQTGEITFTPQRMITDDRRILVEFQYTANEFTRTLVASQAEAQLWQGPGGTARARLGATFLREADSRQFNAELGLSPQDSLLLVGAGDAPAQRSGAEPVARYDPEAPFVQYVRASRPGADGQPETYFEAVSEVPDDTVQVYRVRFTRVGQGSGSYARVGRSVNGILYEYRGPGQGDYEPVRLLPKPRQQRLFDLHGSIEPVAGLEVFGEWARSLNDENRLSSLDAADDLGDAYLAGLRLRPLALTLGAADLGHVSAAYERRFTGAHFASFDRTRPVEFDRRWNLLTRPIDPAGRVAEGGDEVVDEAQLQWDVTPRSGLQGELGWIRLGGTFRGARQAGRVKVQEEHVPELDYRVEYIRSEDALAEEAGAWLRQLGRLQQPLLGRRLVPHLEVEQERRTQRLLRTDSLALTSLAFVEYRPGLTWITETLEAGGELELRTEQEPVEGALRGAATAWTLQTRFAFRPGTVFNTDAHVGYRIRRYEEYFRVHRQRENTASVVMRSNTRFIPFDRALQAHFFYEALTERTPKLQEIYVRTGPELGQYVWEDSNGDGILQLDEFVPERTPHEGTYVKTFIPSDSLMSIVSVQARLRLELDPARRWRQAEGRWKRLLANVYTRTTVDVLEKSREQDLAQIYLLNLHRFRDPLTTLNGRLRLGQEVYLFRGTPRYGIDLLFNQLRGLTELTSGAETRFLNTWQLEGRYKPAPRWGLKLEAALEQNRMDSEAFASRRYDIEGLSVAPEVSFAPSRAVQLAAGLAFARKEDGVGGRRARLVRLPLEGRYMQVQKLQLAARAEVAHVQLEGEAVGLAQFELTDGRGPGTSFLWSLNGQYTLNSYLRAALSYDARLPAAAPPLHTVRLQLSALF